jgi:hydroxymethylbilane synthase
MCYLCNLPLVLKVGARSSPLSQAQTKEVLLAVQQYNPDVQFDMVYLKTIGDIDEKTSLRTLDKTDFFTKEIDEALMKGDCRFGIHSAKDLPDPLPKGLELICLTKGVDSADALVMREGESLSTLRFGAVIATSSVRREEAAKLLREDLTFIDLRGTIGQRLAKLDNGEADGVIVAEAALIRLGLTHLNRVFLPGNTAPGQGHLAIVAREGDLEMKKLFSRLDTRISKVGNDDTFT